MTNEIATTILSQLGGQRFIAMTGAKSFVAGERDLTFRIGRNKSRANMVRITLDASDTYTVEFLRYQNFDITVISHHSDIYADTLAKFIGSVFGMATSL